MNQSIQHIGDYAFRSCEAMQKVQLPDGLQSIGKFSFYNCTGLEAMVIPTSVTKIGDYALRGCSAMRSVVIPANVTEMGKYALHGAAKATLYCEAESIPAYWSERWNSSRRPVVWGAKLSEDKTYLVSFVKDAGNPAHLSSLVSMTAPVREGYVFAGFQAADGQVYTAEQVMQIPNGTSLTVLWNEKAAQ
jgi:hypothetical protein